MNQKNQVHRKKIQTKMGGLSVQWNISKNGPVYVFLHGLFLNSSLWESFQLDKEAKNYILIDLPSHGKSTNSEFLSYEQIALAINDVLEYFETIEKFVLCGHSLGGVVVSYLANRYPEKVDSLVLLNTPIKEGSLLKKMIYRLQIPFVQLRSLFAKSMCDQIFSERDDKRKNIWRLRIYKHLQGRSQPALKKVLRATLLGENHAESYYSQFKGRKIAIIGEQDYIGSSYKNNSFIKSKDFVIVPGGHVSPVESPKITKKYIFNLAENT